MSRFPSLRPLITATVDLPSYLEGDIGLDLKWSADRTSAMCLCPLHGDSNRSFSLKRHSDGWGFYCFGCHSGGTVVEFFMQYHGLDQAEAIANICERFDIVADDLEAVRQIMNTPVPQGASDDLKKIAVVHKMAATQCRHMLRRRFENGALRKWIAGVYQRMNECIEKVDLPGMEAILQEVSKWNT